MTTHRVAREVDHLGVTFSGTRQRIYLRVYPTPPAGGEIAITLTEATHVVQQIASALHYLGTPWHELFPAANDLPDEKGWTA